MIGVVTAVAPVAGRAAPALITTAALVTTYEVSGAPLHRTPAGRLLAPTELSVRLVDGQVELALHGRQIDPRTLDPAQPENQIGCRVPIELAPDWVLATIAAALGGRHV